MPIMRSTRSRRLACHTLVYSSAILVGLCMMRVAHAYDSRTAGGELSTADTVIAVEAGEQAPRLTTLGLRGAMVWKNRAVESQPDHIQVRVAPPPFTCPLPPPSHPPHPNQIHPTYSPFPPPPHPLIPSPS